MTTSPAAAFVVFNLLRFQDRLGVIAPEDILAMWHDLDADDARILYHLRNALPGGGPVPSVPGLSFAVERMPKCWPAPVALTVTFQGQEQRLDEADLVATARHLLAADDAPSPPMSAFAASVEDEPPAFLRRPRQPEAPIRKPIPAAPTTRTPAPVKPAPRQKAAPASTQFSLF